MRFLPATLTECVPQNSVNLTVKNQFVLIIASFVCVAVDIAATDYFQTLFQLSPTSPLLVASIGASLVILFFAPHSPLAQPWSFVGGQLASALVGVTCALYIPSFALSCASAVSGSILAMLLFRCLHPPGAATALAPVVGGVSGYNFVLVPVALNVFITLLMVIAVNRWCLTHDYSNVSKPATNKTVHQKKRQPKIKYTRKNVKVR